jgi:hypothetical protein
MVAPLSSPLVASMVKQHIGGAFGVPRLGVPAGRGPTAPRIGGGVSQRAVQRLMLARIPFLKSVNMVPSAKLTQDMLALPGSSVPPIGAGMSGPFGGKMLTRNRKAGGVSLA